MSPENLKALERTRDTNQSIYTAHTLQGYIYVYVSTMVKNGRGLQ
jgi:hypothetical protein